MAEVKVKLGCVLTFDTNKEQDVVDTVEELRAKHKLGKFINALLRVASDNPEVMSKVWNEFNGEISSRDEFFKSLSSQVSECKDNIEVLNDEITSIIAAYKYGASSGLLNNAYNVALASIANDRHLKQVNRRLKGSFAVDTDKRLLANVEKVSDLAVEKVVTALQNVEVEALLSSVKQVNMVSMVPQDNTKTSGNTLNNLSPKQDYNMNIGKEEEIVVEEVKEKPKADLGALNKLIGL